MKSLIRLGLTLSLLGGTVVGQALMQPTPAVALSEADALKRLDRIPVFIIINKEGTPLINVVSNPKDKTKQIQVVTFFMGQQEAQSVVTTLKKQTPEVGGTAKIAIIPMSKAIDMKIKNKDKAESLVFDFVPSKQQTNEAVAVLKQNGQVVKEIREVPLFYSTSGKDKARGILTIEEGKNKIIPFFFNKQDLQGMLDQLKQQDPKLSGTAKIEVTSLSNIFDSLLKENGSSTPQIVLYPDRTAIQFVLEQQKATGVANPSSKPSTPASKPVNQVKPISPTVQPK